MTASSTSRSVSPGSARILDYRGATDMGGRELHHTMLALGDEIAAAAGLLMDKGGGIRGGRRARASRGSVRTDADATSFDLRRSICSAEAGRIERRAQHDDVGRAARVTRRLS